MNTLDLSNIKNIHCVGIGGIGVSGLAELLQRKGYQVSGSDLNNTAIITRLRNLGVRIEQGHKADYIGAADLVVYSSAVAADNAELQAAKTAGIPLISRGQLLAQLMQPYFSIAVVGTHGKTTTTGFIANTLVAARLDPTYVIGGQIRSQETTARFGNSNYFIAEADESDGSFLFMKPNIAIITNIEADHLENYGGDFEQLKASFLQFIEALPEDSLVVLGVDCPVVRSLLPKITRRFVTFGFSEAADFRVKRTTTSGLVSQVIVQRPHLITLMLILQIAGEHNVLNALASVVIANELGISDEALTAGLQSFPGMSRRFHPHGALSVENGKALLFEDYGHHPSAIAATLAMAKEAWPNQRIVLVFQPHRYSRTRDLIDDFVRVLSRADLLVLTDVYAASEQLDEAGSAEKLYNALQKQQVSAIFIPNLDAVAERLPKRLQPDDIVILQGAGNVSSIASKLKTCH